MSGGGRVVVDAGVLIAVLDPADADHVWAAGSLRSVGPGRLAVSALSLAEAMVHPAMSGSAAAALESIRRLGVSVIAFGAEDVLPLAQTRGSSRLRMPDAIVLHTAITSRAELLTTDERLGRMARETGVAVRTPEG